MDLVLIGGGTVEIPETSKEYIHDLGFVSLEDKNNCYAGALSLVNPSLNESFSIVIMESWAMERPVIVNEKCEVTKNFAIESNGGLYFNDYYEFEEILKLYTSNDKFSEKLGKNGRKYVEENFDKNVVTKKYMNFFSELESEGKNGEKK